MWLTGFVSIKVDIMVVLGERAFGKTLGLDFLSLSRLIQ
jgi:hypothetical protein